MSLRQTFARGFVWKLAGLLALAAFGWFAGIGEARAATAVPPATCNSAGAAGTTHYCTRELAYNACAIAGANKQEAGYGAWVCAPMGGAAFTGYQCSTGGGSFGCSPQIFNSLGCPSGGTWNDTTKKCAVPCSSTGPAMPEGMWIQGNYNEMPPGVCYNGCSYFNTEHPDYINTTKVDGVTWSEVSGFGQSNGSCSTNTNGIGQTPPSDGDGDGTSDGNDTAPGNPGQGAGGSDDPGGETGESGEGSGNGNTSTGGWDCATPPNSQGDQIAAQTAYQTWKTACAIESLKDSNGNVKTKESGTGTGTGTGSGGTTGNGTCAEGEVNGMLCAMKAKVDGIKQWMDDLVTSADGLDTETGETEEPESIWMESPEESDLDASGFGWGGSCPNPPTYMGESIDPNGNLCMFAMLIGGFMLLGAYAQAAYIIGRA